MSIYSEDDINDVEIECSTKQEQQLDWAISLLQSVLTESVIENEYDEDIYKFLAVTDNLPEGYTPYW